MKLDRFFKLFERAVDWFDRAVTVALAGLGAYVAWIVMSTTEAGWLTLVGVMAITALVFAS